MLSALNVPGAGVVSYHNKNPDATIWVGNIDQQATEELVWELMCQAGPIVSIIMPRDRVTTNHEGYAFIEYETVIDADYALRIFTTTRLFGRLLRMNKSLKEDKESIEQQEWLVKLFVGGLAASVDEVVLASCFSTCGSVLQARVARDPETGDHRGFGFIIFDSFESGDKALEMNGQYIDGRMINVSYALKKDSKTERHGTEAERLLASKVARSHIPAGHDVSLTQLPHVGLNSTSQGTLQAAIGRLAGDSSLLVDQTTTSMQFSGGNQTDIIQNDNNSIQNTADHAHVSSYSNFALPPGLNPVRPMEDKKLDYFSFLPPPPPISSKYAIPPPPPMNLMMNMPMMPLPPPMFPLGANAGPGMSIYHHVPPPPPPTSSANFNSSAMLPPPPIPNQLFTNQQTSNQPNQR